MDNKAYSLLGSGIRYPFTSNTAGGVMMNEELDRVKQSLFILFDTQKGSRIMQPRFGSNLEKYRFDPLDNVLIERLTYEIKDCISTWEPRIKVTDIKFSNNTQSIDDGILLISISYDIINTDVSDNFVYPYRLGTKPSEIN